MSVDVYARGEGGLSDAVSTPSSTLVLLPHLHDHDIAACLDLLTIASPTDENVLSITFDEPLATKIDRWDDRVPVPADEFTVVGVDSPESPDRASPADASTSRTDATVRTVSDPDDLGALAAAVGDQLSEWADSPNRTVVCLQSLTTMCKRVELPRLFRFLHALCHRLRSADAVSHFHLDPDAVDERTIYTLAPLFDAVVEQDESGSLRVTESDQFLLSD